MSVLQVPPEQTMPAPQMVPHAPQFCASLSVLTQVPAHDVIAVGHEFGVMLLGAQEIKSAIHILAASNRFLPRNIESP